MAEHKSTDVFDALADPTRREILLLLRGRTMRAGDIAQRFSQQRPAISKHLAVLKRAGLLREERLRQERRYSILPDGVEPAAHLVRALGIPDVPDSTRSGYGQSSTTTVDQPASNRSAEFDLDID